MPEIVKSLQELADRFSTSDIEIVTPLNVGLAIAASKDFDEDAYVRIFKSVHGIDCPRTLVPLLALPDATAFAWRSGSAAGEFRVLSPAVGANTHVDSSYAITGTPQLSELATLDQITDVLSPCFVLYDLRTVDDDGLLLFDGRQIGVLTISPVEYVNLAALGAGFDSWQFLFSDITITLDRKAALLRSLVAVKDVMSNRDYDVFDRAIKQKKLS